MSEEPQKTDEELLAEMEAEEAAKAEAARLEAEAKAKADEEARIEAERLAAEQAAKPANAAPVDAAPAAEPLAPESQITPDKINLLQLLEGYTDERHAIHVRLYEMLPFLDGAIEKSDGLLKHILMSLSDILR